MNQPTKKTTSTRFFPYGERDKLIFSTCAIRKEFMYWSDSDAEITIRHPRRKYLFIC